MTLEEVQQLLGKPWRTALTGNGSTAAPWQGTLRWTYTWIGAASAWTVSGWSWSTY